MICDNIELLKSLRSINFKVKEYFEINIVFCLENIEFGGEIWSNKKMTGK